MCNRPSFKMKIPQVILTILVNNVFIGSVLTGDICSNETIFKTVNGLSFMDNITLDTPIFEYDDALSNILDFKPKNDCPQYFKFNGSTVYLKGNLAKECSPKYFRCKVECFSNNNNPKIEQDLSIEQIVVPYGNMFFKKNQYEVKIEENSFPKEHFSFVGEINQTDCFGIVDNTQGILSIEVNKTMPFGVNGDKFVTTGVLDYEEKTEYSIQIVYKQTDVFGKYARTNASTLIVQVVDKDDMDPIFNNSLFIYNVSENTVQKDWHVTTPEIAAYDRDFGEGRQNLTFCFDDDSTTKDGFILNPDDGNLKVNVSLDREKTATYNLVVKVKQKNDFHKSATASLRINVIDENDNVPKFAISFDETWIDEHSSTNTTIKRVFATDIDEYPNDTVIYKLSDCTDQLWIENNNTESGTIKVNSRDLLDRETLGDVLTLSVIAIDAVSGKEGGNMTLNITLKDINDNTPTFEKTRYDFIGLSVGPVGKVIATDKDDPQKGNGKVLYKILGTFSEVIIDNKTGQINVTSPIEDYIEFIVEACDSPLQQSSKRCSQVQVSIHANESASRDDDVLASVYENSPLETVVTVITIKGTSYQSFGESGPFKLDQERGAVQVNEYIDRENSSETYIMNIYVFSRTSRLIANITLTIEILDANDNSPIFDQQEYFFKLPDQLSTGTVIGSVNASDMDIGNNSRLFYYIQESIISPYFAVNSTSGEIRISDDNFPQEKEFFQFPVSVKDNGIPQLRSSCYVYISRTIAHENSVQIGTPYALAKLEKKRDVIESALNRILTPDVVTIVNTEGRSKLMVERVETRSYMYIEATNGTGTPISARVLQRKVLQNMDSIHALFKQQTITDTNSDKDFGGSQIALIVLAVVILIGGIVMIYMIYKSRSHKPKDDNSIVTVTDEEKQTEEPTKLSETDHVSMQSIEITVDRGNERTNQSDQTSDYDGSQNAISESNAVGCINPAAYQTDTQEVVLSNDTMQGQTTSKEVEHELNQLTDMLEEEEKRDGCSMEDQEESSLDVPKLYPSLPINETAAGAHHQYENTNVFPIQDNENNQLPILCGEQEMHDDRDQDRKSSEFIMSSNNLNSNQGEMSETNNEKPGRSYENIVDVLDDEPDIDYNDKQVRFAAVVLDSEENKFEPIKDKEEEQTTEPNEDIDDIGDETVQNDNEDEHEEHGQLEYRPNDETTLQDVIETRSDESALEEEVTAF